MCFDVTGIDEEGDSGPETTVVLRVYTRAGRLLWTHKVEGIRKGCNRYQWDGRDVRNAPLANGLYYYSATMERSGYTLTKQTPIFIMK